jgi:ABC-2 type transport system ATP-binding protein
MVNRTKIDSLEIGELWASRKQRAGKTTFFSLLLDLIQPTTGTIQQWRAGKYERGLETIYGFFLDESFLIGYLTPKNILFHRRFRGQNKADRCLIG